MPLSRSLSALLLAAAVLPACAWHSKPQEPPVAHVPEKPPADSQAPERTTGSAGRVLVYSAITGHVPLHQRAPSGLSDAGQEAVRTAELEAEIQDELSKQEDLSGRAPAEKPSKAPAGAATAGGAGAGTPTAGGAAAGTPTAGGAAAGASPAGTAGASAAKPEPLPEPQANPKATSTPVSPELADPRIAAPAPQERPIPLSLFDSRRVSIAPGTWGNAEALDVVRRSLDVDGDGHPEEVRYFDPRSGEILRTERDTDYDGRMDTWLVYTDGQLSERILDSSGDGRSDVWETYVNGRMRERRLDRNDDGVQDAFYRYEGETLVEERHDADNDGRIDLAIQYEGLHRVRAEEDRDRDGRMDTWTTFQTRDGEDYPARIEHDSKGRGSADVVETYEVEQGKAVLARREEDLDGDGSPDVVSIYEHGKLVAREISNPELTPL